MAGGVVAVGVIGLAIVAAPVAAGGLGLLATTAATGGTLATGTAAVGAVATGTAATSSACASVAAYAISMGSGALLQATGLSAAASFATTATIAGTAGAVVGGGVGALAGGVMGANAGLEQEDCRAAAMAGAREGARVGLVAAPAVVGVAAVAVVAAGAVAAAAGGDRQVFNVTTNQGQAAVPPRAQERGGAPQTGTCATGSGEAAGAAGDRHGVPQAAAGPSTGQPNQAEAEAEVAADREPEHAGPDTQAGAQWGRGQPEVGLPGATPEGHTTSTTPGAATAAGVVLAGSVVEAARRGTAEARQATTSSCGEAAQATHEWRAGGVLHESKRDFTTGNGVRVKTDVVVGQTEVSAAFAASSDLKAGVVQARAHAEAEVTLIKVHD